MINWVFYSHKVWPRFVLIIRQKIIWLILHWSSSSLNPTRRSRSYCLGMKNASIEERCRYYFSVYSLLLWRQNRQHELGSQHSVKILYSKSSHSPFSCNPWKQWNPYSVEGPQYHFPFCRCTSLVGVVWTNSWVNLVLISRHTILFAPCLCWPARFL